MIQEIVQKVFDQAQEFANKQLDKVVDKIWDDDGVAREGDPNFI
jgi:hypothetical protein